MIFASALSHIIFYLLVVMISSHIPRTINASEPVFTVSLSSFPSVPASASEPLGGKATDTRGAKAQEEIQAVKETPPPPKKEPIMLPEKARQKPPLQKKKISLTPGKVHQDNAAPSLPSTASSQESSGNQSRVMSGGSSGITAAGIEDFEYAWYRSMVISKLNGSWIKPVLPFQTVQPLQATVTFIIEKDGSVSSLEIDSSSGYPALDRSAIRAVYDASPLPPLPMQISQSNLQARFIFELKQE